MADTVSLGPWLKELTQAIDAARAHDAAEATHELRVSLARVRLWLWLGEHHALDDDARWLRRAAQPLRDLDVELELKPPRARAAEIARRRPAARELLVEALSDARTGSLLAALKQLPATPLEQVERRIRVLARRALSRKEAIRWSAPELEAMHGLRRGIRRLRYALEGTGKASRKLSALQSSLGDACDAMLALAQASPTRAWAEVLEARRGAALKEARRQWKKARPRLKRLAKKG